MRLCYDFDSAIDKAQLFPAQPGKDYLDTFNVYCQQPSAVSDSGAGNALCKFYANPLFAGNYCKRYMNGAPIKSTLELIQIRCAIKPKSHNTT